MEAAAQIKKFREFIEQFYLDQLLDHLRAGKLWIELDFSKLAVFEHELADDLLESPEEVIKAAELAIAEMDLENASKVKIRLAHLVESQYMMIRNVRSVNLNKLYSLEGIVRQKSDVRPQVTAAKFECPSCGNVINVLQLDQSFREPSMCSCGRKGKFTLMSKELVDAQGLVLEESPERLQGGEQPKRMNVFLKDDLVSPLSERKTNPGSKIQVIGYVKEIPIIQRTGVRSVKFDLYVEANNIIPIEETFIEVDINPEEEKQILELSHDVDVLQKLSDSIAPSIFGYEKIKQALVLQMIGGLQKTRSDGVVSRGDMHVLLIGDPGAAKSAMLKAVHRIAPKGRYISGKGISAAGLCVSPNSWVITNPGSISKIEDVVENRMTSPQEYVQGVWKQDNIQDINIQSMSHDFIIQSKHPATIWKLRAPEHMIEVTLSSGKIVEVTPNTQLFTIIDGYPCWQKSSQLYEGQSIATPRRTIEGKVTQLSTFDLIKSNPVVHGIKAFVREIVHSLSKKYGNVRSAARALNIKEDRLYWNWVNTQARGNIKLNDLKKLCTVAGTEYKSKIGKVSLYNGKNHTLPEYINKDLLYVAGLIAGDGDIRLSGETYSIRFSNKNDFLHHIFQKTMHDQFTVKINVQKGNQQRPLSSRIHSKLIAEIFFGLGIPASPKSHRIAMSEELLKLSNDLISQFIAGIYDTDGSVSSRDTGSDTIEFCTCSSILAKQLQLILLRFGIHAWLRKRPPTQGKIKGKYERYVVTVFGIEEITKFSMHIPLRHPNKRTMLNEIISKKKKSHTNSDIIPGISSRLEQLCKKYDIPIGKWKYNKNLSREYVKKIIDSLRIENKDINEIKKLVNGDIYWEKIRRINIKKPLFNFVYDLTVDDSHNFIVDGVLVHNTATVVKDEFLRGWSLEAGAMVLASDGLCCIDEMDKMNPEDTAAMHEALENQTVSISKANIQATLIARTTVLAAANPQYGRFDPYKMIADQINLPPTLINRFDLIFPIKDLPNKERYERLTSHILGLHQNPDALHPIIAPLLLKKYVAYAKQKIRPVLSDAALEEIKSYYLKMRASGSEEGALPVIPISARQLEALVRLSEASARARLSSIVTKKDAQQAVDLLHYSLNQVGLDPETGKIDIDRIASGVSASQRNNIFIIKELITDLEGKLGKTIPIEDIVEEAKQKGISNDKVDEVIEKLKRSGDVFEPRKGFLQKI